MSFATVFLALSGAVMLWSAFMLVRNEWVYSVRMQWLDGDLEAFHKLPSYDAMMRKWWVWKAERFLPPPQKARGEQP